MPQRHCSASGGGFMTSWFGAATIPTVVGWSASRAGLESIPALMVPLAALMVALHRWLVQHAPTKIDPTSGDNVDLKQVSQL